MAYPARQLNNINRFVYAVYGVHRQLSDILHDAGVSDRDANQIRYHQLEPYMAQLALRWEELFQETLPARQADIVMRYYGLSTELTTTLQQLGDEYRVSRERIRQLREHAVAQMKNPGYKKRLEQLAYQTAQAVLQDGRH
jgi:DNA-directed RNA polymerase sigma subunit (sigma70/sigma32)